MDKIVKKRCSNYDWHIPVQGTDYGCKICGARYHCANCGGGCGMMAHYDKDGFYCIGVADDEKL